MKKYVFDADVLALYFAGRQDTKRFIDEVYSRGQEHTCAKSISQSSSTTTRECLAGKQHW